MSTSIGNEPAAVAYLRGEGKCHLVIGFERNGGRYVWRIRKPTDTSSEDDSQVNSNYSFVRYVMSHLLPKWFVVQPKIVELSVSALSQLPRVQLHFNRVEAQTSQSEIWAEELPDLCYFADLDSGSTGDTVTVELKPKQGFFPASLRRISPYCTNCLLQIVKSHDGTYREMYDFCPLDLYSRDYNRVYRAIDSLIKIPHANLKVFRNGHLVHANRMSTLKSTELGHLFGHRCVIPEGENLPELLAKILMSPYAEQTEKDKVPIRSAPLLQLMLLEQKKDRLGPFAICSYVAEMERTEYSREDIAHMFGILSLFLNAPIDVKSDAFRSVITASLRDCSLMITMKMVPDQPVSSKFPALKLRCGCFVVYRLRLIDLDFKPLVKLSSYARRLRDAADLVRQGDWVMKRPLCLD